MLLAKVLILYIHLTHFTQNYIFKKKKESKSKFVLNKYKYLLFCYYY